MRLEGVLLDTLYLLFGTDMYVICALDGLGSDGHIARRSVSQVHPLEFHMYIHLSFTGRSTSASWIDRHLLHRFVHIDFTGRSTSASQVNQHLLHR